MNKILIACLLSVFALVVLAQNDENAHQDSLFIPVPEYDKLCPIIGGDSVRYNNNLKATGLFKDYYPGNQLKHKGYYENGKIVTTFTNYYLNGQAERDFKPKSDVKGTLYVYYPDGTLLSKVEWIKGESIKWEDFYPDGKPEFAEEFHKSFTHYLYMRSYYENGNPRTLFELTDPKQRIYSYREYYENGQLKEEGTKIQNQVVNDYQMEGKWLYYSKDGKLIMEEEYVHGQLIDDKQY